MRSVVPRVDLVLADHHVETSGDKLPVPDDHFAGLIQTAVGAVRVGALRQDRDFALRVDAANGVVREVGHVDVVVLVNPDPVDRPHLRLNHLLLEPGVGHGRVEVGLGEHGAAGHAAIGGERHFVQGAVAEVAHEQIPAAVEGEPIGAVLAVAVGGHEADQQVLVVQRIVDGDVLVVQPEAIDTADQQAVFPPDLGHHADRHVHVAAADADAVGMADRVGDDRGLLDLSVADAQPEQPALIDLTVLAVARRPVLVVGHVQIAVRAEGESHRRRAARLGVGGHGKPGLHFQIGRDLDQTRRLARIGIIGTRDHQVAVAVDRHAIRRGARIRQRDQQSRHLQPSRDFLAVQWRPRDQEHRHQACEADGSTFHGSTSA